MYPRSAMAIYQLILVYDDKAIRPEVIQISSVLEQMNEDPE